MEPRHQACVHSARRLLGTVYDELVPYGVTVAGGRAGGNSFYSASHGMACDAVANFEVVLANGNIVNANKDSNTGLCFDMYPIDYADPSNPVVWGGNLFYELSSGPAVIDALVDFTDNAYKDESSSSIVYRVYLPAVLGGTILNAAIENTRATVKPRAFDGYYAVAGGYDGTTKVGTLSAVANELGSGQPAGFRIWLVASFENDARPINYAVEKFIKLNAELEKFAPSQETGLNTLCMFQPITKSIVEKGVANGGNVMGLESHISEGNGIMFLLTFVVHGREAEERALPLLTAYMQDLDDYAEKLGVNWGWCYLNYAHSSQDVISSFGEDAVEKLQAAAARYDPDSVSQRLRGSGFKLT
ncbi:uncharacterized protein J7T54_005275 [Emericellopsis cladophorae]|uniref:FAD-binding PCMH-type domain-containing protein n=1 Tax=Emericellopsis cladophorae TaxID=2686198 RepID=A0A9Q0BET3_9HYPO|nr:uncharacterized protein J7T54_005275 [Emericellopsis cladophorae]KAI6781564.1 hypothetical protein J7T54_005275 [Emericellopsis cladophorae]